MKKQDLLTALEIVKPGLSNKEIIEQSTSFAFINGTVVTYNDEISISYPVEGLNITGAINAKELYQLLRKIKKDEIEIAVVGNEIQVTSGRSKAGMLLQNEIKIPIDQIGKSEKYKALPSYFIEALRFAVDACSRDMSKPALTCVHINEAGFIEGSDSFSIARFTLDSKLKISTVLIPATSIRELIKLEPIEVAEDKGWMHFRNKNKAKISCRVLTDAFPDTTNFLKVKGEQLTFPKTTLDILDRAVIFNDAEGIMQECVFITLEKNKIKINSKSTTGWFEETSNTQYSGNPASFGITPCLLRRILSEVQNCVYNERTMKFKGEQWEYVIALRSVDTIKKNGK
jgi:hypothetical protein